MRDPAASLSLFPIEFRLGDRDLTVPPGGAGRWVELLLANDLLLILGEEPEGLLDTAQARVVEEMLLTGAADMPEVRAVLQDILTTVAGRDWWEAAGLVHTFATESHWARLHGQMVAAGVDVESVPFGAWLDLATFLATQHMDERQLGRFMGLLQTPPAEVGIDEDREGAAFLAMMNG